MVSDVSFRKYSARRDRGCQRRKVVRWRWGALDVRAAGIELDDYLGRIVQIGSCVLDGVK
jgi:hypothetical protein